MTEQYDLYYDGECVASDKTMAECYALVKEWYEEFEAEKAAFPQLYDQEDVFDFASYAVFQYIPVDFEKFLTTDKRDTFPKTFSVEGKNFID